MKLWHKDLIPYLPKKVLLSQWETCCHIAKDVCMGNSSNNDLVKKVMDYPIKHFWTYSMLVFIEMQKRGYDVDIFDLKKWISAHDTVSINKKEIFPNWHNIKYLLHCYFELTNEGRINNEN